jgi:putative ATP-dependent endonuclease of OLD family
MIIKNIRILNYRNFRNFEIELKPFTLIIGENNIGKTNLLNAIGLVEVVGSTWRVREPG